jgi:FlaA1/EpsC-like NDP-sugar epimerase
LEVVLFRNKNILITGGTGSWGQELVTQLLDLDPNKIIVFSRGELAQVNMERKFQNKKLEFVIGDVRDQESVNGVMRRDRKSVV